MSNPGKTFKARSNLLLATPVLIVYLALLDPYVVIPHFSSDVPYMLIIIICMFFGGVLFLGLFILDPRYGISGDTLTVKILRFIPFLRANIADITTVKRSHNPVPYLGISLNRLRLDFADGRVHWLVSPLDEGAFIAALKEINPAIHADVADKKTPRQILSQLFRKRGKQSPPAPSPPQKMFRSRVSILLIATILAVFLPPIAEELREQDYVELYSLAGVILYLAYITAGNTCTITGGTLSIKCFFFIPIVRLPIAGIVSVKRAYNLRAAYASSPRRLRLDFANGRWVWHVSPAREREFIDALQAANPAITADVTDRKGLWRILGWDV